jgi:hypothetical protein
MGVKVTGNVTRPAPQGVHQAVCVDVVDLGMVESNFNGEKKLQHKVKVVWQINELNEETGRRYVVSKRYTASLHEKSSLRKDLQSWRGRPFTPEELRGFDLDILIGLDPNGSRVGREINCQINLVHKTLDDGRIFANVEALMPLAKGMVAIDPLDFLKERDRKPEGDEQPNGEFHATDEDCPF